MSGSGREALSGGQETAQGCPEVVRRPSWLVGMPSRMTGSDRESHPDVQQWS